MASKIRPRRSVTKTGNKYADKSLAAATAYEKDWEVERILSKKVDDNAEVGYLVKWMNYEGSPTWEPESNCTCELKIAEYEKRVAKAQAKKKPREIFNDDTDVETSSIMDIDLRNSRKSSSAHGKSFRSASKSPVVQLGDKRISRRSKI